MTYIIIRLLHLGAILVLAGAVIIENIAIKPVINTEDAHNLATVDRVAGFSAALTLGLGMMLWLVVGKPSAFYSSNPLFHAKVAVFVVLVAAASYPAVFFNRHRATTEPEIVVPKTILLLLKLELVLLLTLPVLAYLMARGVGLNS
ncbi:MAG: putative membrane protein [Pseudohongiellaceae bacterium]|jgi:putative membrane protein